LFSQVTEAFPAVQGVSKTDSTTITVTGTDFFISDYDAGVTYGGIEADSVTVNDAQTIVATFDKGVPVVRVSEIPIIKFESQSSDMFTDVPNVVHFAISND